MKSILLISLFMFLVVFVVLCFLDALFLGEVNRSQNALFAGIIAVASLINLSLVSLIRKDY